MEWPLVKTVAQRGLSKLPTALANPLLRKLAPFDSEKIIVDFTVTPFVSIDSDHHDNKLYIEIRIRNFNHYPITHYNCECWVCFNGAIFLTFKDSDFFILKPGQARKYKFRHPLSDGEVRRIQAQFNEQKIKVADYHFMFTVQTRFGPQVIEVKTSNALIGR